MRSRLIALMLIPTLFGVIMTGLSVYDSARSAAAYRQVEHLAKMSNSLAKLTHELEYERDLAAGYIATAPEPAQRNEGMLERLRGQYGTVDTAADEFRKLAGQIDADYSSVVRERVRNGLKRLDDLASLRTITTDTLMPALPAVNRYSASIVDLQSLMDEVAQGASDPRLGEMVRAHTALTRAKDQASKQRGVLFMALLNHKFASGELEALTKARAEYESALGAFRTAATVEQRQLYEDTVSGSDIDKSETLRTRALALVEEGATQLTVEPGGRSDAAVWLDSMNATVDRMRSVEVQVGNGVQDRAVTLLAAEQRAAYVEAAAALLVLALVLLVTVVVARSMVRPLNRLRDGALQVAEARLPDAVRRLRESEGETAVPDIEPIEIDSSDEIGEVARAFDEVHREALRLAADEAMLRSNVNAMFVNLSRRSQTLIERQLKLISGLEQSEQEPDALDSLFKLDHLATRMRRNCENLLVLSGQEVTRRWSRPVPLVDVLRASLSEVEQYERVQVQAQGGMSVVGRAVNDLVHLTAELVENATAFSPQSSKIVVAAQSIASGAVMLEITDSGIGMSHADLADANWRLANPPVVDVSVSRRMGLFVVGRLASRHGIQVQLRPAQTGGLTALVVLPVQLLADASGTELAPPPAQQPVHEPARDRLALTGAPSAGPAHGGAAHGGSAHGGSAHGGTAWPAPPAPPAYGPPDHRPPDHWPPDHRPPDHRQPDHRQPAYGPPDHRQPANGREAPALPPAPPAPPAPPVVPEWAPPEHEDDQVVVESVVVEEDTPRLPRRQAGSAKGAAKGAAEAARAYETAPMPRLESDVRQGPTTAGRTVRTAGQHTVVPPPGRTGPSERLPIFDSVESDWFRRDPLPEPGEAQEEQVSSNAWSAPSDYGWQAAESVAAPESSGTTEAGLPRRVPGGNLVPGSARQPLGRPVGGGGGDAQSPAGGTPLRSAPPARSADRVRSRFSSLQKGAREGRAAARTNPGEGVEGTRPGAGGATEQENE